MEKNRLGRPLKRPEDRKAALTAFRAEDGERDLMQQAAGLAGLSLSDWIRTRLVALAKREIRRAEKG